MPRKNQRMLWVCLSVLLAAPAARGQTTACSATPEAAVQCFVINAVNSRLASLPPNMTLSQFQAYGVSVSNILQSPSTLIFLLGTMGAAADALPPVNADGLTPNQAAQDAAVSAIVDAGLRNGLISLPDSTSADQLKLFARQICAALGQAEGVTFSSGTLLRFLDSYVVNATRADGSMDWTGVRSKISSLVDSLVASGLLKLPDGISAASVKQFAYDVAVAIHDYKLATGRATL